MWPFGRNDKGAHLNHNWYYSTCTVAGDEYVDGFAGENYGRITMSFWSIETSGHTRSYEGTGKTTAEIQTTAMFLEAGWDFVEETDNGSENICGIDKGQDYQRLWWEDSDL